MRVRQLFRYFYYRLRRPQGSWSGNYQSWSKAQSICKGYSDENVAKQMVKAARAVIEGKAFYCRDGVTFDRLDLNWQLIACAQRLRANLGRPLRVIDFGGGFGDVFLQNRAFLSGVVFSWVVVEQEVMLRHAQELPRVDGLNFCRLEQALSQGADLIVLSSVLQYLDRYDEIIKKVLVSRPGGIFLDRTGFVLGAATSERITIQTVRPPIYNASYPCRFFVKSDLIRLFLPYVPTAEWRALDAANIPSHYLGLYFERPAKA